MSGDLRFLSHHDVMRLMERAAARAELPLQYSQGFNPRPRLSLPLPRPVGVASRCELMVLHLAGEMDSRVLCRRLGRQLPAGVKVLRAEQLPHGRPPRITSASYEMTLLPPELPRVRKRLRELGEMERWNVARRRRADRRRRGAEQTVNVKDSVRHLALDAERLSFTLLHDRAGAARCPELPVLVGLARPPAAAGADAPTATEVVTRIVRMGIEWEPARRKAPQ